MIVVVIEMSAKPFKSHSGPFGASRTSG